MREELIRSEHHLICAAPADRRRPAVLLLEGQDGWALPRVESEERRSADVADLNRGIRAALGMEVSVLRCLVDSPGGAGVPRQQLYEIEIHAKDWEPPSHGRWVGREELAGLPVARPEQREQIERWLAEYSTRGVPLDGRDWTVPG